MSPSGELLGESAEELYEEAPCGYVSALPNGTVVRVNRWVTRLLGRSKEDLLDEVRLQELFTVGGRIYWETHVRPLLEMQGRVEEIALELAGDGRRIPILLHAELRRDAEGEPIGIRATLIDVTERRRYERELVASRNAAEDAARRKGTLVTMISHDIRNPLSSLLTASELLAQTSLDATQEAYLGAVARAADRIRDLLDTVLDIGRIESGHARLDPKPFDLRLLLEDLSAELYVQAQAKGLGFAVDVDRALPEVVVGDPIKLGRVLGNLMGNAIKFTDTGEVTASVGVVAETEREVQIHVEVRDTGIGIGDADRERIFDDFTQASSDIRERFGGTGLGLGICKRLLALHGSTLELSSRVGEGATFFFDLTLPRAVD